MPEFRHCPVCDDVAGGYAGGLCHTCYTYRLRNGRDRPIELIIRKWARSDEKRRLSA